MIYFDSWSIEVYNDGWVNVTDDVKQSPTPRWNRGIMGNKPTDRVANTGYFNFSLDNSASNSAGLAGYYSPGHANCWSGWTTGLAVRLSFIFENIIYYKYFGRIKPDGIDVDAGSLGSRTVAITCTDIMYRAQMHELDHLDFAQNKGSGYVVRQVINNMPVQPIKTEIAVGIETFPTVFDMSYLRTTAAAEFYKAAMSEFAFIYPKGDISGGETLVVEDRATRVSKSVMELSLPNAECVDIALAEDGFYILDEDGFNVMLESTQSASFDNLMSDGMKTGYGKTLSNRVNAYVYPRKNVTSVTLYSLEKSFKVNAGETITDVRVSYRDPDNLATMVSGINIVTPVRTTHYTATANEDGSGANMDSSLTITGVLSTEGATMTIVNSHATTALWVQTMTIIGDAVYTYNSIQSTRNNNTSQAAHGVIPISLDFKYLADVRKAQLFSDYILGREALPRNTIEACPIWANSSSMSFMGFLRLEPGEKATFAETQTGINGDYFINGYSAELVEGKFVKWSPVLSDDLGYSITYTGITGSDTYLVSYPAPDRDTLSSFYTGTSGISYVNNGLIKFDLSSIPSTAIILSAALILKPTFMGPLGGDPFITVYRLKRAWVPSEATWLVYSTGNSWGTAGGENTTTDRDLDPTGLLIFPVNDYSTKTITLDETLVQEMVDGTMTNNGFMIKSSTSNEVGFASFENTTTEYRPRLIISYRE